MFTAKPISKEEVPQGVQITVEFSNGVKTITETVIPQDRQGYEYWLKARLASLNTSEELLAEDNLNKVVDFTEPVVELTQAEKDRNTWLQKYYHWVRIKETLIDTGIIPANNAKAVALLQEVKTTLKPEYIDII